MNSILRIVHEGGWKGSRVESIKVKAWVTLFLSIAFGGVAVVGSDSWLFYSWIPAAVSLLLSALFLFREEARSVPLPRSSAGSDLRKLYGALWREEKSDHEATPPASVPSPAKKKELEDSEHKRCGVRLDEKGL